MAMTRSHKANNRDHVGLANGTASPEEHLPRYFTKSGVFETDPRSTKKKGSGKGNWGKQGDELADFAYNPTKPRRRSNSLSAAPGHSVLRSKFETVEPEPVFEEELHGPTAVADEAAGEEYDGVDLEHESTRSSAGSGGSVEEEDMAKVEKK